MAPNERITPAAVAAEAIKSGPVTISTMGDSMLPHLESNRWVRVEQLSLRFGDLGAVINDVGTIVVHRYVVTIRDRSFWLGDNNQRFDPPIDTERVLGRVTAVEGQPRPARHRIFLIAKIVWLLPRELRVRWRRQRG